LSFISDHPDFKLLSIDKFSLFCDNTLNFRRCQGINGKLLQELFSFYGLFSKLRLQDGHIALQFGNNLIGRVKFFQPKRELSSNGLNLIPFCSQ
jgi:hypothetical protein